MPENSPQGELNQASTPNKSPQGRLNDPGTKKKLAVRMVDEAGTPENGRGAAEDRAQPPFIRAKAPENEPKVWFKESAIELDGSKVLEDGCVRELIARHGWLSRVSGQVVTWDLPKRRRTGPPNEGAGR